MDTPKLQTVVWLSEELTECVAFCIGAFYTLAKATTPEQPLQVELFGIRDFPLAKFQDLLAIEWNNQWQDDVEPLLLRAYLDDHGILYVTNVPE